MHIVFRCYLFMNGNTCKTLASCARMLISKGWITSQLNVSVHFSIFHFAFLSKCLFWFHWLQISLIACSPISLVLNVMHLILNFMYNSMLRDLELLCLSVMYSIFHYWFTKCFVAGIYSPNAYRGFAREFIKDLERIRLLFSWFSVVVIVAAGCYLLLCLKFPFFFFLVVCVFWGRVVQMEMLVLEFKHV